MARKTPEPMYVVDLDLHLRRLDDHKAVLRRAVAALTWIEETARAEIEGILAQLESWE